MLQLIRPAVLAAAVAAFAASVTSQTTGGPSDATAPAIAQSAPTVRPAPPALMAQFHTASATVQSLTVPAGNPFSATIPVVLGGRTMTLQLAQRDVRTPSFQLLERTATGLVTLPRPVCTTYRGNVLEDPGSTVAATIRGGSVEVLARLSDDSVWGIQPVRDVRPAAAPTLHIAYRSRDNVAPPRQCGVQAAVPPVPNPIGEDVLYECELACEADYPFYQQNGSNVNATQSDITTVVNAMNVIYNRDVDIDLSVTQIIVNSSPDPYSTTSASTLLNQFASRWNSVYGGVQRDVAHLFTGRNINGGTIGIATLGTVCNVGSAYGLSQSRYTSNFTLRTSLTAHEIGHNFGAGHCNTSPPCYIMCAGNGGCGNPTLFGTAAQNQIIAFRQAINCLTIQPTTPVISTISQIAIPTVQPPQIELTGSGFLGATHVTVGASQVNAQVLSDSLLRFYPPIGLPLGFETVTVTTALGTSNASTLWYQNANPAILVTPIAVIGGTNMEWRMGGVENDFAFLVLSLQSTTSPWMGWQLVDAPIIFWTGGLDARGMATTTFPVPANTLSGLRVYSQLLDIQSGALAVRSLSDVENTLILF